MINKQDSSEEQFIKFHDKLRFELNNISEHLEICNGLTVAWKDHTDELNIAPTFFMLTLYAHRYATLMGLNRLLDTKPHHLSIYKFLDFIKENLEIFSHDKFTYRLKQQNRLDDLAINSRTEITLLMVENDIQKVRNLPTPNIRRWRNETLAHMQAESVLQGSKVSETHPIKTPQIENAINTIHEILNFYYLNFLSTTWAKSRITKGQIDRIVKAIRFYINNGGR